MEEKKEIVIQKQNVDQFFSQTYLQQALDIANQFHKAGCFGKDVQNVHQAFVKIQAGREMGMAPMEAMKSLYIVNGNITIWGSAMTKRLREAGWIITYSEEPGKCTARINKGVEKYEFTATKEQMLNLKSRAYGFAPEDKLRWHAISRLVRFYVPEVLGAVSYTKEEAEDFSSEPNVVDVTEKQKRVDEILLKLKNAKTIAEYNEATTMISITVGLSKDDIEIIKKVAISKKTELAKWPTVIEKEKPKKSECPKCKKIATKADLDLIKNLGYCYNCEKKMQIQNEAEKEACQSEYPLN